MDNKLPDELSPIIGMDTTGNRWNTRQNLWDTTAILVIGCVLMGIGCLIGRASVYTSPTPIVRPTTTNIFNPKDLNAFYATYQTPRLIWLMSFPNSGTSFTTKLVRHVSHLSTASNYGVENLNDRYCSVPVYPNTTHGPFWIDPKQGFDYQHPTNYILTKTHCGSRCEVCPPSQWIENTHSFKVACLSGSGVFETHQTPLHVRYDETLVKKAVHLIRNPFDNVVSRFHLEQISNSSSSSQIFALSREGFRSFCHWMDQQYQLEEEASHTLDVSILNILHGIPCHADFFRFIQWHNLAFVTTESLRIPTYVLHYELYDTRFNETVVELMNFLELPITQKVDLEFIKGKEYATYFTKEELETVKIAMEELSLSITWDNVKHYF